MSQLRSFLTFYFSLFFSVFPERWSLLESKGLVRRAYFYTRRITRIQISPGRDLRIKRYRCVGKIGFRGALIFTHEGFYALRFIQEEIYALSDIVV